MANQISVNSGTGNITVTTSRSVIGTVANVATANYANFAGEAYSVNGANVVGSIPSAGTVTTNAQPNITSVGNLTNLDVVGTITTGNLVILGNLQVGNLVANTANYANFAGTAYNVSGANVVGAVANAGYATDAGTAAVANSVSLANVSGAGNIASINLDGNVANALLGDGTFGPVELTTANYANFAGNAYSVDGANVNGTVANATYAANSGYADNANVANIANAAYNVDVANVSGIGNIATINLDGNVSNVLRGDGTFAADANSSYGDSNVEQLLSSFSPNPIFTTGNVTTGNLSVQGNANITGNISTFSGTISGSQLVGNGIGITNIAGGNVSGTVANASYAANAGYADNAGNSNIANTAYSVDGANVSGDVAGANHANIADNANVAYSVDVANVSGIGNIATVNLDGNVANALLGNGTWGPVELDTANYANFAGNAFSVDGANVVGTVANATFALDAGNANIANVAYSVDGANVIGTVANANLATYANIVVDNAQPNITSVGTLTDLNVNSTSNVLVSTTGSNLIIKASVFNLMQVDNTSNSTSATVQQQFTNPNTQQGSYIGTSDTGINMSIANTNPGNSFPTNLKGVWRFESNGNLSHLIGGTGNINAKGLSISGNIGAIGAIIAPNITANTGIFTGNASGLTNIPGANVTGTVANATFATTAGTVTTNAQPNITSVGTLTDLTVSGNLTSNTQFISNSIIFTGGSGIDIGVSDNLGTGSPRNLTVTAGNISNVVTSGSPAGSLNFSGGSATGSNSSAAWFARGGGLIFTGGSANSANGNATGGAFVFSSGSANTSLGTAISGNVLVQTNIANTSSGNATSGTVTIVTGTPTATGTATVGSININVGTANGAIANVKGNINIGNSGSANAVNIGNSATPINMSGNVSVGGNIALNLDGTLDYLRTFGSFTSNATQTSNGANVVNKMTFNNTEDANGVSVVSNTQLTVARTGRYNIQFSTVLTHNVNQTANVEIWLTKNGSAVANTNTRLTVVKDQATTAAWNFVDNASTANTYYELAWASPDTSVQLLAVDNANTIAGVAIPSVIATITPVGA